MNDGVAPTVAQAAEAAKVSRTTAYRYFPTQESLLVELSLDMNVDDVEALVARPLPRSEVAARLLSVLQLFNRHVFDEETRYRTAMRLYQDMWLAAVANGDDAPILREGRRRRWIADCLAPLGHDISEHDRRHLTAALALVAGPEPMVVLRDVCRLNADEALAVTGWAIETLIAAVLERG